MQQFSSVFTLIAPASALLTKISHSRYPSISCPTLMIQLIFYENLLYLKTANIDSLGTQLSSTELMTKNSPCSI